MFRGYPLYIFVMALFLSFPRPNQGHVLPKGFHISNSCQPRCRSGLTCVIFRTSDGTPNTTCKDIDPHSSRLDGSLILTDERFDEASRGSSVKSTTAANEYSLIDIETLIKPLLNPPLDVDTFNLINSDIAKPRNSIRRRMDVISDSVKTDLQTNIGERPNLFSPDFTKEKENFPLSPNPTTVKKISNMKGGKFSGLELIRNAAGVVVFRRKDDSKKQTSSDQNLRERPKSMHTKPNNSQQKIANGHSGATAVSCKSCTPGLGCPPKQYCYYSSTCARQICQRL